ncbi:MAG: hypothetical protein GX606_04865 [Elusimicrobia bacterium]|nr:hypothetical protein [Elusimicrobiota bacterium]
MARASFLSVPFLFFCSLVLASPTYGPTMPTPKQAFWGLQHYSVLGRTLDNDLGKIESRQNFLTLSYGIREWLSLDLKWSLHSRFRNQEGPSGEVEFEDPVWGGGYGARVRVFEDGPWKGIVGFHHTSIHPRTLKANGVKRNGIWEDWQVSGSLSYEWGHFVPYAGLLWSTADEIIRIDKERNRIKSDPDRNWGVLTGLNILLTPRTFLNLEVDWRDDAAVACGLHVRF